MEFTQEQIENIWRRVLKDLHDPTGAFDPLMLMGDGGAHTDPKTQPVPDYRDYRDDYDVYADIENSVYGKPDASPSRTAKPEEPEPQAANPLKQPGKRLQDETNEPDPEEKERVGTEYMKKHIPALIEEQLEQSIFCRALSRAAPNRKASRALTLIANRNYSSAKSISSAYFMAIGDYHFPRSDRRPDDVPYYRSSLRNAWKNEVSLTTCCTNASEKTEDVPFMKALLDAARGHAENAVELRRLIEQSLD